MMLMLLSVCWCFDGSVDSNPIGNFQACTYHQSSLKKRKLEKGKNLKIIDQKRQVIRKVEKRYIEILKTKVK